MKTNFYNPNGILPVTLPEYNPNLANLNYYWLAGFINTDGSLFFSIYPKGVTATISIAQHTKSLILLEGIVKFLNFGNISKFKNFKSMISLAIKIINLWIIL